MSMGRGRGGRSNITGPPTMPDHQEQDPRRRELRRPMAATPDDVARGLARMDPFNNSDYASYPNASGNTYGGPMIVPPPRPAPSADGWSSGENQFEVFDPQNQHAGGIDYSISAQQQMFNLSHAKQAACGPQWNIGASEFVPKSNLSAGAAEFVPRTMPRNTSQWGYQNQPQQQHNFYQTSSQPAEPSYHQGPTYSEGGGVVNPYLTESSGSAGSLYNIEEQLSDAIATIVYMPAKLDRTCSTIADKINSCIVDVDTLVGLANALMDICFSDLSFRPLAARFCATISKNVTISFEDVSMLSMLIERCQTFYMNHLQLMSKDPDFGIFAVEFMSNFFYYLDLFQCPKVDLLAEMLFEVFNNLLTVGSSNLENLQTAINMLKICGKALEHAEKRQMGNPHSPQDEILLRPTPKVDQLMSIIAQMSNDHEKYPETMRKAMQELLDYRARGIWGSPSCLPALPAAANEVAKPRSNAILIQPDPNDRHNFHSEVVISKNVRNPIVGPISNQEMALTEEEVAFMNEHMLENSSPGESDLVGVRVSCISTSGDEDDMPDDVQAAYEEFLQGQTQGNSGGS